MRVPQRLVDLREARLDPFLRSFEWSWTAAVLVSLALLFFILIFMVVVPSFWMYYSEQKLGWGGPSGGGDWSLEVRDAVAMGLVTAPFVALLAVSTLLQNYRRKIRGRPGDSRPTGGYR